MNAIQILSSVLAVLAFGVSVFVAWTTYGQLQAARETARTQNLFSLLRYLQEGELHIARHTMLEQANRPYDTWTEAQNTIARRVCSSFDFAGVLVRHGLVDSNVFLDFWGEPIRRLGAVLDPFLAANDYYWKDCYWLIQQAQQHKNKSVQGSPN